MTDDPIYREAELMKKFSSKFSDSQVLAWLIDALLKHGFDTEEKIDLFVRHAEHTVFDLEFVNSRLGETDVFKDILYTKMSRHRVFSDNPTDVEQP